MPETRPADLGASPTLVWWLLRHDPAPPRIPISHDQHVCLGWPCGRYVDHARNPIGRRYQTRRCMDELGLDGGGLGCGCRGGIFPVWHGLGRHTRRRDGDYYGQAFEVSWVRRRVACGVINNRRLRVDPELSRNPLYPHTPVHRYGLRESRCRWAVCRRGIGVGHTESSTAAGRRDSLPTSHPASNG